MGELKCILLVPNILLLLKYNTCLARMEKKLGFFVIDIHIAHTGQCKRTGGCYNELVVAFYSTGGGVKGKKSIPVDFIIYL